MNAFSLLRATTCIGAKELRMNLDRILRETAHPYRVMLHNKPAAVIIPDAQFLQLLELLEELKDSGLLEQAVKKLRMDSKKKHAWFWSPDWQAGEEAVDKDIRDGRMKRYKSANALFKELDT
jgi:PHD/YefM family antitoxin component YafN of YafNO toxin-antitoxin module